MAVATLLAGVAWIGIAIDPRAEANVASDFRPFSAIVGVATLVAGTLAATRRRDDIVVTILGALTGASFAVATALLTRPATSWAVYSASVIFAALLFGVLLFRGAFRPPPSQP